MLALIGWMWTAGAAGAAEVLLPPATPLTVADEQVAEIFYRQVVAATLQTGLSVEDADSIRTWAMADAEGCFDNLDCPALLWSRTDARLAMIVRVGKGSSGLIVETRWVDVSGEVRRVARETVPYGKEASYAGRLALMLQEVQAGMPAAGGAAAVSGGPGPAGTAAGSGTAPVPAPIPAPRVVIQPAEPLAPAAPPTPPTGAGAKPTEPPPNRYRLPKVVYDSMVAAVQAGKSEQQWMVENRVRSGRLTLQISGGMGFGDVSRGYLVDAQVSERDETALAGQASWEGATSGVGFSGFVAIGYSPLWYLDLSMSFGMLYGQKHLTVTTITETAGCSGCEPEVSAYDPQAGVQALIEPRLRLLPLATGVAKPYLLLGLNVRIYDGFDVPDDGLSYRNAPGGMGLAPSVGGGLYIDALPDVSFFIEVPYTMVVPAAGVSRTDPEVPTAPAAMEHMGGFVRVLAGLEVRL